MSKPGESQAGRQEGTDGLTPLPEVAIAIDDDEAAGSIEPVGWGAPEGDLRGAAPVEAVGGGPAAPEIDGEGELEQGQGAFPLAIVGAPDGGPYVDEPTVPLPIDLSPGEDELAPIELEPTPTPIIIVDADPEFELHHVPHRAAGQGAHPSAADHRPSGEVGEVSDDELEILDTPAPERLSALSAAASPGLFADPAPSAAQPRASGGASTAPRTAAPPPPVPSKPRAAAPEPGSPGEGAASTQAGAIGHSPPPIPALLPPGAAWPEALAQRPRKKRLKPWFEEVFDEDYLRTLPFMTPEQTLREVSFIKEALNAPPDGQLLDIGCGYGRHAIELGQRGLRVTGIDLSLPLLIRAADESQRRSLSVNFVHADMREMAFDGQFDGAYCMLTTFGYFDEETNLKVAASICRALKPGGRFLLDTVNRDYLVGDLPTRVWWEGDGCVVLEEVDFNYHTSRMAIRRSVVFQDGRQLEHDISIRAYGLHEIGKLLRQAGFRVLEVSGGFATKGQFFGAASRNIVMLCERPLG
jgi:SAM-dependent methyltransferase